MNIFFYASAKSTAAEQFVEKLLATNALATLTVLPGGSHLNCEHSLRLRNSDVIILFATSAKELQELLAIHEKFQEFKVVLILPDQNIKNFAACHILKPRFISFTENDMADLEKVILKMQGHTKTLSVSN